MIESNISAILGRIRFRFIKIHIYSISALISAIIIGIFLTPFVLAMASKGLTLGGPDETSFDLNEIPNTSTFLQAVSPLGDVFGEEYSSAVVGDDIPELYIVKGAILLNSVAVSGDSQPNHNGDVLTYTIQEGDSLSTIADKFGISLNTIKWANSITKNSPLKKGEDLTILPVSGVLYEAKTGDTIESISSAFGVSALVILQANEIENRGEIKLGDSLIIPDGKPLRSLSAIAKESSNNLPSLPGYFAYPVPKSSLNWGVLHISNAVDFANVCGTTISASAAGMVIKAGNPDLWNGGYGGYLVLEHQNGTETLYGHTSLNLVDIGKYVEQNEPIAKIGKTGKSTGCHVHFEVHGAKNPFVK